MSLTLFFRRNRRVCVRVRVRVFCQGCIVGARVVQAGSFSRCCCSPPTPSNETDTDTCAPSPPKQQRVTEFSSPRRREAFCQRHDSSAPCRLTTRRRVTLRTTLPPNHWIRVMQCAILSKMQWPERNRTDPRPNFCALHPIAGRARSKRLQCAAAPSLDCEPALWEEQGVGCGGVQMPT